MCKVRQLIPIVPVILGLSGCGVPKPIAYYGIQIPAAPMPQTYRWPIALAVGRINGSNLLEASPIVYKIGHNQFGTYQYHHWTEAPVEMVQEKLIRLLQASGDYQSVSGAGGASGGEFELRGWLYDFTEVDGDSINGLVSMEFELCNPRSARVLWWHFYSQMEPVEAKQVSSVVQALDRNLDRGLKEVIAGLNQYFAVNPPGASAASSKEDLREPGIK